MAGIKRISFTGRFSSEVTPTDTQVTALAYFLVGSGVPSDGALGNNGDVYLDSATSNLYLKAAGTWSIDSVLKFTANNVINTPSGTVTATDIQSAINELDSEKVNKSGDTITGNLIVSTMEIDSPSFNVNNGGTDASSEGAGIEVERVGTNGSFIYENALDSKFKVGDTGSELEISTVYKGTKAAIDALGSWSSSVRYHATDEDTNYYYDGTSVAPEGTPLLITRIYDEKTVNTAGGTATSGSYIQRDLNTQDGDTSFCSLSSNDFTLDPGTYLFNGEVTGYQVDDHRAKIIYVTGGADLIMGSNTSSHITAPSMSASVLLGSVTIASSTAFRIVHQVATTRSTDGYGVACNYSTEPEIYTHLTITKLA